MGSVRHIFYNSKKKTKNSKKRVDKNVRFLYNKPCVTNEYVSDDDVVFCLISSLGRRCHSDLTAGKAFTHIVVAVSSETDAQALRNESAEALAAGSRTVQSDRILRQAVLVAAGDLGTEDGTESTVRIGNFHFQRSFLAFFYGSFQLLPEDLFVLGLLQFEVINVLFLKVLVLAQIWIV